MLILLGNGSRVGTWLKTVELGLGLTFVLKKNRKTVFLVIRIGQTLLQKQIIPDSLISCSHRVQFRSGSPLQCLDPPETRGLSNRTQAFLYFMNTLRTGWFIELFCRILSFTNTPASCSVFFVWQVQAVLPYCSKLQVLIFSYRLVLSYQLDWTLFENRVLFPHRHKYSVGDIIVSQAKFLFFLFFFESSALRGIWHCRPFHFMYSDILYKRNNKTPELCL